MLAWVRPRQKSPTSLLQQKYFKRNTQNNLTEKKTPGVVCVSCYFKYNFKRFASKDQT